jgi:hypothetical protein
MRIAMKRYIERLSTLKEMVQTEGDFGKTFDYFFDHLAADPEFTAVGKKTKHTVLKQLMDSLGRRLFGEDAKVSSMIVVRLRRERFYHGSCLLDGRLAAFFLFEDIDRGMAGVTMSLAGGMHYVRFSAARIPGDKAVIMPDPNKKPTIH